MRPQQKRTTCGRLVYKNISHLPSEMCGREWRCRIHSNFSIWEDRTWGYLVQGVWEPYLELRRAATKFTQCAKSSNLLAEYIVKASTNNFRSQDKFCELNEVHPNRPHDIMCTLVLVLSPSA